LYKQQILLFKKSSPYRRIPNTDHTWISKSLTMENPSSGWIALFLEFDFLGPQGLRIQYLIVMLNNVMELLSKLIFYINI